MGIVCSGIQTCEGLISCLDSHLENWKPYKSLHEYTSVLSSVKNSVADLSKLLHLLVESLFLRPDLDEEATQCVSTCLSDCDIAFLDLAKILEDLRKQDDGHGWVIRPIAMNMRTRVKKLMPIVAKIREHLEPAVFALKHNQADANTATTSGFQKEQSVRYRVPAQQKTSYASNPAIGPVKTLPRKEDGELADASRDADSRTHKEHNEPKQYQPEAGEQQLADGPPATMRTESRRRVPFCYLLAALGLVFTFGSSAVGLYYSIAKDAMGDGFTTAGYVLAVGTLVVTPPAAYHYQHCRCWISHLKSACHEGVV